MVGKSISNLLRKLGPLGYKQLSKLMGNTKADSKLLDWSRLNLKDEMLNHKSFDKWLRQTTDGITEMKMKEINHAKTLAKDYGDDWFAKTTRDIDTRYESAIDKFIKNPNKKALFDEYTSVANETIDEAANRTKFLNEKEWFDYNMKWWNDSGETMAGLYNPNAKEIALNANSLRASNSFTVPIHELKHFLQENLNKKIVPLDWSTMKLPFGDIFGTFGYQKHPVHWGGLKEVPGIMRRQKQLSQLDPKKIIKGYRERKPGAWGFSVRNMDDWYEAVGKGSDKGRMFYRLRPSEISARMSEYRSLPFALRKAFEKGQTLGIRKLKFLKEELDFATGGMTGSFEQRLKKLNKFHAAAPIGGLTQMENE